MFYFAPQKYRFSNDLINNKQSDILNLQFTFILVEKKFYKCIPETYIHFPFSRRKSDFS